MPTEEQHDMLDDALDRLVAVLRDLEEAMVDLAEARSCRHLSAVPSAYQLKMRGPA